MVSESKAPPAWLWLVAFVLGWPLLQQVHVAVFLGLVMLSADAAPVLTALLMSALAWFVTRFAAARGASRRIWITTFLGTLPVFVFVASVTFGGLPDEQLRAAAPAAYAHSVYTFALWALEAGFLLLAPVVSAWLAARIRNEPLAVPAIGGETGI